MNTAPMAAYQGSKNMKRLKEDSKADREADRGRRENTKRDRAHDAAGKTIAGKGVKVKVKRAAFRVKAQSPFGGDDLGG